MPIYHPPAHTMFGSLFNIYMTMQWFIGAVIILCSKMEGNTYAYVLDSCFFVALEIYFIFILVHTQ